SDRFMVGEIGGPARGPRRFEFLDGLRGVLSVYVLCTHVVVSDLYGASRSFRLAVRGFRYGQLAVDGFIVLSGFSLMLPVAAAAGARLRDGFRGYIRRRARRILPAYLAALAISVAVLAAVAPFAPAGRSIWRTELSPIGIGSHVLLVHTLVPGQDQAINSAFWSIATEWHIYFFFPLLLLPVFRRFGAAWMVIVAVVVGSLPQFVASDSAIVNGCPWLLGLFALGAATASAYASQDFSPRAALRRVPWLFAVGIAAFAISRVLVWSPRLHALFGQKMLSDLAVGLIWACVILYGACLERVEGLDDTVPARPRPLFLRLIASPSAVALGGISYSLYATHMPVLRALECSSRLMGLGPVANFLLRLLVGVPLALGVAALFARWFERPFLSSPPGQSPARRPTDAPRTTEGVMLAARE
ncbi:MAG TPA: acyltransferase, partial [Isosphaeraceae bacterium]